MMKIKQIIVAMFCMVWLATSCKKEQTEIVQLTYQSDKDSLITVKTNEALILAPKLSGKATSYQWMEEGKEIANTPTYSLKKVEPGIYNFEFIAINSAGKNSLKYKIKVIGTYGEGVLLLNYTDQTGLGNAQISHLTEDWKVSYDVFSKVNPGATLSSSANNLYYYNNQYYITSSSGPNYLTVVDAQTLKLNYVVNQSGASGITYFATTDGKTGYVNVTNRRKPGLYPVDLVSKSIGSAIIEGSKDATLLPIKTVNGTIVSGAGKQFIKIEAGQVKIINTYKENVSGIVKTAKAGYWLGVQGSSSNKAKFVKLDQNNKGIDSVELNIDFKLPANGILTSSGADEYLYWQETSRGVICRFNTSTKTAEDFVNQGNSGIIFSTSWKVNPKNGDLYIADSPGIFSAGEPNSNLYIFDKTGKLKKEIKNAGYQITDIVFPQ